MLQAGAPETRNSADDTQEFFLPGGPSGCLLLHGFTGTPQEVRYLGERLHARGHSVSGVRLAGHCAPVEDLERCRWQDWYASSREGLTALQRQTSRVAVVGLSMGALLAAQLAIDYPAAIGSVVLLAPALSLSNRWLRRVAPALPLLMPLLGNRWRYLEKGDRDIADAGARATSPSTPQIPLRALHQLLVLQQIVRRRLSQIGQPVLVVHSRHDHTCPVANAAIVARAVRGPVETVLLDRSYHVISIDVEKERVADTVAAFVERTLGAPAATAAAAAND